DVAAGAGDVGEGCAEGAGVSDSAAAAVRVAGDGDVDGRLVAVGLPPYNPPFPQARASTATISDTNENTSGRTGGLLTRRLLEGYVRR
ncbi:MAG TPA: hypothetical protein VNN12_08555, partial [Dehalococcoidia bacterium]|nr:hypothetical protein [Dehalococcoidia bacterium]